MIELKDVVKRYGHTLAVDRVSFSLGSSGVVGLLGQNGAGKSTVLNMITGYLPPDSGQVLIGGRDIQAEPRRCKRDIGYLPERPPLYPEMTVAEYLRFVCRLRQTEEKEIPAHSARIMAMCGLEHQRDRLAGSLSKGYQQRLGFAQALCGDPPVLILDEPTAGMDPVQVNEIRALMQRCGESHLVLFSTHLLPEAQRLCGRVLILHQGRLAGDLDLASGAESGELAYDLVFQGDSAAVAARLRSLPALRRLRARPCGRSGCGAVELAFSRREAEQGLKDLFHLLCGMDVPIMELVPRRDSLEDLFLRIAASETP